MDDVERVARAVREEIVRQYRESESANCPAGVTYYEEYISPHLIATAAIAAMAGWMAIDENTPTNTKIFLWCPERIRGAPVGAVFGRVVKHRDLPVQAYGEGMNGDWTFTHWRPNFAPPTAAGSEG